MKNNKSGVFVRNGKIYVQGMVNGEFIRKSTGKDATKANMTWARKNAEDVLTKLVGVSNQQKEYTLQEFGYLSLEINSVNRREPTNQAYRSDFKLHVLPYFKRFKLSQIKAMDIKAWQAKLLKSGLSAKRVIHLRGILNGILQDAYMDELIDKNPISLVKRPKMTKTEVYPFSLEEIETLIRSADGWFKNFLKIAFFTGMRTGELIGLKWEDINLESGYIKVKRSIRNGVIGLTKNGKAREVDILPIVAEALRSQFRYTGLMGGYVFVNQYGRHYRESDSIKRTNWKPLLLACKIDYRILYHTRHTFASIMLQQGEEIGWVSHMMGHADIHTTLTKYAKYIPRKKKKRATFIDELKLNVGS